jgi:trimethylamine--corrinoid protein Co-methyltransferase
MGLLESCTLFIPEQLVLDADLHERVRCTLAAFDTSRTALALDVIKRVGPKGQYLYEQHTRDELRRRRFSPLTGRAARDGTPIDPLDAARAEAARILAEHHPEPLDAGRARELARIVAAADREAARGGAVA